MLAMNADNAAPNDTQTAILAKLKNSFEEDQRARCFNHTIQLSAKTLLHPFNTALGAAGTADRASGNDDTMPDLEVIEDDDDDNDDDDDDRGAENDEAVKDADDQIDELEELEDAEREELLAATAIVRETVSKASVNGDYYMIDSDRFLGSTTIFCNYPFHYPRVTCLAPYVPGSQSEGEAYPTGCRHTLEFDL
jgi:hypothetical protein